ncbi:MAG: hypothetical protein NVSMB5_19470 [Candidatus Velthaea sp.]
MVRRRPDADDAADRDLLARIARGVLAFVRDIVDLPELAEEVAADVMIAVWKSAGRYRGAARAMTWVLAIAHHKSLDALRRREHTLVSLDAASGIGGGEAGPEDIHMRAFERTELESTLATLSAEHRAVLQLMYGFSRSLTEIAEIAGCPVATFKTRPFDAKRKLRDALDRAAPTGELA